MVEVVLDSDIVIDWLRDTPSARHLGKFLSQPLKYSFYITSVTQFELLVGAHLTNTEDQVLSKIKLFDILNFDYKAASIAAKFYASLRVKGRIPPLQDLFIASICISFGLPLITRNTKDFVKFKNLELLNLNDI